MKKIGIVALMLVLLVGGVALAQGGFGTGGFRQQDRFTEEQLAELAPILEQMDELRAQMHEVMSAQRLEYLEELVEAGELSAERLEWLKQGWALAEEEGTSFAKRGSMGFRGAHCWSEGEIDAPWGRAGRTTFEQHRMMRGRR